MKSKAQRIIENYSGGSLYLGGCDLKGITLPQSVGGSLYLRGCDLKGITLPSVISGKRGHAIAFDGEYLLWASDDGTYSAGCIKHLTLSQAMTHWDRQSRQDDRAILFTLALGICAGHD